MLQHCYVPHGFGFSLIVPLLKDKHGDMSQSSVYRGISLSPVIAKLFEYVLLEFYEDQLVTGRWVCDDRFYGLVNRSNR